MRQLPWWQVRGEVHHDRRLHQLMLAEAARHFDGTAGGCLSRSGGSFGAASTYTSGTGCSSTTGCSSPQLAASLSDSATSVHSDLAEAAYLQEADSAISQTMSCRFPPPSPPSPRATL